MHLVLVDGNSYVYRAFYAIRNLSNSKGFPTNAVYGFTTMLLKVVRERQPDRIAVVFDSPEPTERHRLFEAYKANRPETPQDLVTQLPYVRMMTRAFGIPQYELPGYEADDIIGTIARKAETEGTEVEIITSDKDMLQLVSEKIRLYDPVKDIILGEEAVRKRFGVGPDRVTEFLALTGDAVDNIPGIKGVGDKTAREVLSSCGSLEEIFARPDCIPKEKLRDLIVANRDVVLLSRKLATITLDVPLPFDLNSLAPAQPDVDQLLQLFRELEFTSLMKLLPQPAQAGGAHETVVSAECLHALLESVTDRIAFDTESTGLDPMTSQLVGIALCFQDQKAWYIPVGHSPDSLGASPQIAKDGTFAELQPILANPEIAKIGHNLKFDLAMLGREGISVDGPLLDTMIAAHLLNPNRPNQSLDDVSLEYLSRRKRSFRDVLGARETFADVPIADATRYAAEDALLAFSLSGLLFSKLHEEQLARVYDNIEMPLIPVLLGMETAGVRINGDLLSGFSREITREIETIRARIYFLAGEEFNIQSPRQLATILFDRLGLPASRKTKTGFSTGMDVLAELAGIHELPREVLQYRSLSKLKTTYLDVLPTLVNPQTGRLHTSFNQTATATGRLSSSDPNLQNIPIRGDWGRRIRSAFIAEEGKLLLSADYSQVELRILAHLSGDPVLGEAFRTGIDIHARTAAEIFSVPLDRVTADMRRTAKTVNFGVIYGISAFGLSEALNISRRDAETYIRQYYDRHPGVRIFTDETVAAAARSGFVTTLFGRRRPIPELASRNRAVRSQGERLAINSPIQGTAADIIKLAMIRLADRLPDEAPGSAMILQVHDELLFEVPEEHIGKVSALVRDEMEHAASLSVPLQVELGHGKDWAAAH